MGDELEADGALEFAERPAAGEARGLLVLHHGRGTDERDLLPLAEVLDPQHLLHVVTPRGPLTLPGIPGRHWYPVAKVGTPDTQAYRAACELLAAFHDELWERTGLDAARTILGGFSMGTVMSYALGLGASRPMPAGILAFSGFLAPREGWELDLPARRGLPVFIAHGSRDAIIDVSFGRAARDALSAAGLEVSYHESEAGHHIDPRELPAAAEWLRRTLSAAGVVLT